jgi:hypothetical protein
VVVVSSNREKKTRKNTLLGYPSRRTTVHEGKARKIQIYNAVRVEEGGPAQYRRSKSAIRFDIVTILALLVDRLQAVVFQLEVFGAIAPIGRRELYF